VVLVVAWWALVLMTVYTYAGYPMVFWALARLRPRPVQRADIYPTVSLIIAAHNEEICIREKLENTLALDYLRDKLEILVASDSPTDDTHAIVAEYAQAGVRLNVIPEPRGRSCPQNKTVELTSSEALVFSDANSMCEPDAVSKLVRSFVVPLVGYVSGELRYRKARSAIGAWLQNRRKPIWIFSIPYRFCVVIFAALKGTLRFLRREKVQVWDKASSTRVRSPEEN
jgi:cellulose synthase/poly-beta-1,6-N-acetylglucosamine synthase-like glycosyltransferase